MSDDYDCLQICTLCHGCGQDGDEGDANGEGAWIGTCGRCDGSGLEQSSECDVIGALVLSLRASLTAAEKRLAVANKLWALAVEDGWPWADGDVQDNLTELGLLRETDMRAEGSPEECTNCVGGCHTCYRAIEKLEDLK